MVAGTFNAYTVTDAGVTELAAAATTNGAAGMISIMFMVFAVVLGLIQKKFNLTGWKEAVVGIVCIVASFAIGMNCPLIFGKAAWSYITFVYIFFAAVLPMWLLKQPRDYDHLHVHLHDRRRSCRSGCCTSDYEPAGIHRFYQ